MYSKSLKLSSYFPHAGFSGTSLRPARHELLNATALNVTVTQRIMLVQTRPKKNYDFASSSIMYTLSGPSNVGQNSIELNINMHSA